MKTKRALKTENNSSLKIKDEEKPYDKY
jgi:hypothetical protein